MNEEKAFTLIRPGEPMRFPVDGGVVWIKALTNGQKIDIAKRAQTYSEKPEDSGYDDLVRMIALHIDRFEGHDGENPGDVLVNLKDPKTQTAIMNEITGVSQLSEDEIKNLLSSPAVS